MRRRSPTVLGVLVVITALMAATASAHADAGAAHSRPVVRATWVWDRPEPAALVAFLVSQHVGTVFVEAPADLATSPDLAWFEDLRTRTLAAGITLQALGAETSWLDDVPAALSWQRQVLATGLFDGVHVDVEPWQHAHWASDRRALLARYVDLLGAMADDTDVPFEADIPFWLDRHTVDGTPVDRAVIDRVDAVTVMSYRDTVSGPDSITGVARKALQAAARAGKPARLAVETHDLGCSPVARKQTFYGATGSALHSALADVDAAERSRPAYAGIAVHDVTGWRSLVEGVPTRTGGSDENPCA